MSTVMGNVTYSSLRGRKTLGRGNLALTVSYKLDCRVAINAPRNDEEVKSLRLSLQFAH